MKKLAILASGEGSNLHAIIQATKQGELPAHIVVVVCDRVDANALNRAINAAIPAESLPPFAGEKCQAYDQRLARVLDFYQPDYIVLAGFMRILSPEFIALYPERIVNIHPSLLPNYKGLHTYKRVLADGQREHGSSVHFVNEKLDQGPIVAQVKIPIAQDETPESLRVKTQHQEHQLYPQVLGWLCNGLVQVKDERVWLGDECLPVQGKQVPLLK